jgi:hypothetical protein
MFDISLLFMPKAESSERGAQLFDCWAGIDWDGKVLRLYWMRCNWMPAVQKETENVRLTHELLHILNIYAMEETIECSIMIYKYLTLYSFEFVEDFGFLNSWKLNWRTIWNLNEK